MRLTPKPMAHQRPEMAEFSWTSLLAPAVLVAGWYVVNQQNENRETRKEIKEIVDETIDLVNAIHKQARHYHLAFSRDIETEESLRYELQELERKLGLLRICGLGEVAAVSLRRAITQQNFGTQEFITQAENAELLQGIGMEAQALNHAIVQGYIALYWQKGNLWSRFVQFFRNPLRKVS
jgi:hypothetical protein